MRSLDLLGAQRDSFFDQKTAITVQLDLDLLEDEAAWVEYKNKPKLQEQTGNNLRREEIYDSGSAGVAKRDIGKLLSRFQSTLVAAFLAGEWNTVASFEIRL